MNALLLLLLCILYWMTSPLKLIPTHFSQDHTSSYVTSVHSSETFFICKYTVHLHIFPQMTSVLFTLWALCIWNNQNEMSACWLVHFSVYRHTTSWKRPLASFNEWESNNHHAFESFDYFEDISYRGFSIVCVNINKFSLIKILCSSLIYSNVLITPHLMRKTKAWYRYTKLNEQISMSAQSILKY